MEGALPNKQPQWRRFWQPLLLLCLALLALANPARADSQQTYLQCLTNFETYAESIWHTAAYSGAPADAGYWGDGGSSGNGGIRGNSGIAVAYAVLVVAIPGDARTSNRLARIRQALNYDTATHVSGTNNCVDGHPWGWSSSSSTDWQTPEWSGSMGLACILVQNQLPAATVQAVQRVVTSEASHRAGIAPASGYVGDTKAEENAWDSNILSLGAAWMNSNSNAATWLNAAKQYLVNSYTVANTNGDSLANWVTTVNLYPSYALENHGFYHPTYEMVAGMSLGDSLLMAQLANPAVATQLQAFAEHNIMAVWTNNLRDMVMDSGDFAYPAGLDWELHDFEQNSYITWMAAHFNDPLARRTDGQLAQLARYRQSVNGDGTFVGPSGGGFYREAVEARRTAIAWLLWAHADYPTGSSSAPAPSVTYCPDVGVITHRSPFGFFSLSYGSRIMAVVEPSAASVPTNAFIASPRLPGILGLGALGNPTSAQLISFATNANGFDAELTLQNGTNGTTEVYVKSTGETIGMVEVPSPVASTVASIAGSFDVGIENDPLTGGTRLIEWAGGSATVTNRSGASVNISNNWVCVAGRYGMAAGPSGSFNYQASTSYNRLGAAEDTLQFMPQSSLGPRYAVWFPAKNATQTMSNATSIGWTVSGTNGLLSFPGPGGVMQQITVVLPAVTATYPPYQVSVSSVTASSFQAGFPPTNAVNNNFSDFWVSSGTLAGQGPTPAKPEWLKFTFPRSVAVSEFQVYPRTANGGYGPQNLQMLLNGNVVYTGSMGPVTTLDVHLSPPITATNAQLLITSSYARGNPVNPPNVQVVEVVFAERAQPGTFGDWSLQEFSDAQLADPSTGAPLADPDHDGVPNLMEFATGGNPWVVDATSALLKPASSVPGTLAFRFQERKNLGGVQRHFYSSTDMINWTEATPLSTQSVSDLGSSWLMQTVFPALPHTTFYRLGYRLP
jgi:hypothetical protein